MRRVVHALALTALLAAPAAASEPVTAEAAGSHQAAPAGHGEGHGGNPMKNFASFDYKSKGLPAPFLAALLNFGVLVFLLIKFARPKLVTAVKQRHDELKKALDEGRALREETRRKLAEAEARLAKLDAEIAALVAGIRATAEAEAERVLADARLRAAKMEEDARLQIAAEREHERALIQREALALAVAEAEKLLLGRLGPADQRALAERFVADLEEKR